MTVTRRNFLVGGAAVIASVSVGSALLSAREKKQTTLLLSAGDSDNGQHRLLLSNLQGDVALDITIPQRAHDACYNTLTGQAVFFSRRPGTAMYVVDLLQQKAMHAVASQPGYHFYGHGVFSADGRWLFTTENDFVNTRGIIGVYDASDGFKRIQEFNSGAIGPHQLAWMNDGHTLVVANGGILTHPDSEREKLNIDTMQPALSYIDSRDGTLLDSFQPSDHQMSVRHLAVSANDQVIIGVQYEGDPWNPVPLVLSHKGETSLQAMQAEAHWPMLNQYIASVAINSSGTEAITTTPRGSMVSRWNLQERTLINAVGVRDVAGAAYWEKQQCFVVSNGLGQLLAIDQVKPAVTVLARPREIHWDNHMTLIG